MNEQMVRLDAVEKRYGAVQALLPTSIEVRKGEFLTLLGPSGSGKTTILNLISGSINPSSGSIWIAGRDVTRVPSSQRRLGMVFQNYALMPHMTVFENIAFPLRVRRLPEGEIKKKVRDVLDIVRLGDYAGRKPKELSGGQQQRVAIARCLVYEPDLILMDEPLGALDKKLRDQLQSEIRRLHRTLAVTMIYVTHDQGEALVLSDRICLMNHGRIEQIGTPEDLYFRPRTVFSADFLGESNILDAKVAGAGDRRRLEVRGGLALAGVAGCPTAEGAATRIMIRPEGFTLVEPGDGAENQVRGVLDDITLTGGVVDLRVKLKDDTTVNVRQLTRPEFRAMRPGTEVTLSVRPTDVVVLDMQS